MHNFPHNLLELFLRNLILIRECEESFVEPILDKSVLCPCHLYSGQEAIATGLCTLLEKNDKVFGTHRSHGHYLAKGGSLNELVAEIYCKESGCCKGRGGSMHLVAPEVGFMGAAPIVGGTIPLALGAGYAAKVKKDNSLAVSFFGDGATGEGVLLESMNIAALNKLPVIFACENNLYSTHLGLKEIRSSTEIYRIAEPLNIKSYRVDGNDVMAVADSAQEAIALCRNGQGPVFMEFLTYRTRGHVGPDDNIQGTRTDIRPQTEISAWLEKDPIEKYEKYLIDNNVLSNSDIIRIRNEIKDLLLTAHSQARNSSFPDVKGVLKYVYN